MTSMAHFLPSRLHPNTVVELKIRAAGQHSLRHTVIQQRATEAEKRFVQTGARAPDLDKDAVPCQ